MITKLELNIKDFQNKLLEFDLLSNVVTYIIDDKIIKQNEMKCDIDEFRDNIKSFITYLDYEYINNKIIDGIDTILKVYVGQEVITYHLKNKLSYNYSNFINYLKEVGKIYE